MSVATGLGYDVHPLVEGRPLVIGGVTIPHTHGLLGHSDADVLTHAIIDALLGAAALGDIGEHFPDTDERYRDADSIGLLSETVALLTESRCAIEHIDATVILEQPARGCCGDGGGDHHPARRLAPPGRSHHLTFTSCARSRFTTR